eukprot:scaffold23348_cov35-Tisochrysis_lutea.AAC.1
MWRGDGSIIHTRQNANMRTAYSTSPRRTSARHTRNFTSLNMAFAVRVLKVLKNDSASDRMSLPSLLVSIASNIFSTLTLTFLFSSLSSSE